MYKNACICWIFWCDNAVTCIGSEGQLVLVLKESIYRLNGPHEIINQINLINLVHYSDVVGVTRLIAGY